MGMMAILNTSGEHNMAKKYDEGMFGDAHDMAETYWMIQIDIDPNVHLSLQKDSKKLNAVLFKWTKEFYKLIVKHNPSYDEVVKVIQFVYSTKYYSKARYSAGYFCSKYVVIRELMERIEFQPLAPEF